MKTNQSAALLCETGMKTDDLRVQSKEMKFLCHTALGDPTLQSQSFSALDSHPACKGEAEEGKEPNKHSLNNQQTKGATCSL